MPGTILDAKHFCTIALSLGAGLTGLSVKGPLWDENNELPADHLSKKNAARTQNVCISRNTNHSGVDKAR